MESDSLTGVSTELVDATVVRTTSKNILCKVKIIFYVF